MVLRHVKHRAVLCFIERRENKMFTSKELRAKSNAIWTGRMKSSSNIMTLTLNMVDHAMGESGDWTPLAHHLAKAKSVGADRELANVKLIVRSLAPGVKIAKDEKQPSGIRLSFKEATKSNQARDIVMDLIARKVSITGTAIGTALGQDKAKRDVTPEAAAAQFKRAMAKLKEAGFDKRAALAMVETLYNQA